jgi:hypothetical protein
LEEGAAESRICGEASPGHSSSSSSSELVDTSAGAGYAKHGGSWQQGAQKKKTQKKKMAGNLMLSEDKEHWHGILQQYDKCVAQARPKVSRSSIVSRFVLH